MYIQYIDGFNVKIKVDFKGKIPLLEKLNSGDLYILWFSLNINYSQYLTPSYPSQFCLSNIFNISNILQYLPSSGLIGPLKIVDQNIKSLPPSLITSSTANINFFLTTSLDFRQFKICSRFSFFPPHSLQLTFVYPLFPALLCSHSSFWPIVHKWITYLPFFFFLISQKFNISYFISIPINV